MNYDSFANILSIKITNPRDAAPSFSDANINSDPKKDGSEFIMVPYTQ
jgi:hypothetical protein